MTRKQQLMIRKLVTETVAKDLKVLSERHEYAVNRIKIYENSAKLDGLPVSLINEGIMDMVGDFFDTDALFDTLKIWLIDQVMGFFGISKSDSPIIYTFVQNVFEAIDYTEVTKYFGSDNCEALLELATEAITETVTEVGADKIIGALVGEAMGQESKSLVDSVISTLGTVAQEALNEVAVGIAKGFLQEPMKKFICGANLTDVIGQLGGEASNLLSLAGSDSDGEGMISKLTSLVGDNSGVMSNLNMLGTLGKGIAGALN